MKPLNRDEPGCNFTSSNCVIWQGPDIPCIKLCKGDSVSDVIHKLATELCSVLDTLDIDKYDISCLNLAGCAPANFHDFLQALINLICQLQDCCANGTPSTPSAQDSFLSVQMPVNPMYYYTDEFGNQITTMTGRQYLTSVGNQTATTQSQLDSVTVTVAGHTTQIQQLQTDVASIPPPNTTLITPVCVAPSVPTLPDQVIIQLESQFCLLQSATGNPNAIFAAVAKQCTNLANQRTLSDSGITYGALPGWKTDVFSLADSHTNAWLYLCDIGTAIRTIQTNCCPTACSDITLSLTTQMSGSNIILFLVGSVPVGFINCVQSFNVTISDTSGGSINLYMDVVTNLNLPGGFIVSLASAPIDITNNLTTHIAVCLTNPSTSATCSSVLDYVLINQPGCPSLIYVPTTDSISYSGPSITGTYSYDVQLWNSTGTVLVANQVQVQTGPTPVAGVFSGLTPNSSFKIRVVVTDTLGVNLTECPFSAIALDPTVILPVNMRTAGSFAALAGSGIASVGTSTFIGNVGSDPTNTITNIVPGDVTGALYTTPNPAVVQAKIDLGLAVVDAAGRVPVTVLPADTIGGSIITPGIYGTPFNTIDITGALTLDALGDVNAVFIFNVTGVMTTAAAANIILLNGATFNNIFWNIGDSITIGAGSTLSGIFMAQNNIISGAGSDVHGALLTEHGLEDIDTSSIHNA